MHDAGMNGGVEKSVFVLVQCVEKYSRDAQRSHGVPDSNHFDRDILQPVGGCELLPQLFLFVRIRFAVRSKNLGYSLIVKIDRWNSKTSDHAPYAARSKCSAAESKKEYCVTRVVDIFEKRITILHLLEKT